MQSRSNKAIICLAFLLVTTAGTYLAYAQETNPDGSSSQLVRYSGATETISVLPSLLT